MNDLVRPDSSDEHLLRRIRGEYLEMPGLRLTRPQAQRLWGLDDGTSARVLQVLVDLKFLVRGADGTYARLTEGTLPGVPLRMVKVDIDAVPDEQGRETRNRARS